MEKPVIKRKQFSCSTVLKELPFISCLEHVIGNPQINTSKMFALCRYKLPAGEKEWVCVGGSGPNVSKTDREDAEAFFNGKLPPHCHACVCSYPQGYWEYGTEEDHSFWWRDSKGTHYARYHAYPRGHYLKNNYYLSDGNVVIVVGSRCRNKFLKSSDTICLYCFNTEGTECSAETLWFPTCPKCTPKLHTNPPIDQSFSGVNVVLQARFKGQIKRAYRKMEAYSKVYALSESPPALYLGVKQYLEQHPSNDN